MQATDPFLSNGAVPNVVEVVIASVKVDIDPIASSGDVLVVQRLVQVTDKVHDEFRRLGAQPRRQLVVQRLLGIVGQGADDAARLLAITIVVNVAVVGRAIVGVDEVKGAGEAAPFSVPYRVRPGSDSG